MSQPAELSSLATYLYLVKGYTLCYVYFYIKPPSVLYANDVCTPVAS